MPGARRGALPLAVFIIALFFAGLAIAISRGGDGDPMADDSPTPTFTVSPMSPTAEPTDTPPSPTDTPPTTTPASPTDTPTETPVESPTTTSSPTESPTDLPTTIPPTDTPLPTTTGGGDMPRTGMPVGGWLFGGLALMLASTAMMRALSRRPA